MVLDSLVFEINSEIYPGTQVDEDTWTIVPRVEHDGYYAVAVWATDIAGNVSFRTALLWVYNGKAACIRFIDEDYNISYVKKDGFALRYIPGGYSCRYVCPARCEAPT